ncbi:MAG: helix-turn-helix domain-containing protein [Symploca sp. SIO1A3]|nr:helix-turn-helix domain-containing protein [Symploca sp. SIO2C1]NER45871.1 helix-turn-helix domain-containing protein [Symploca sp. SIO1A3]
MKWGNAFNKILRDYGVSAKWLSEKTGLSQQAISAFRKGKSSMTTDNLDMLLSELPFEAKSTFFALVLGGHLPPAQCPTIEELAEDLPREKKKKLAIILVEAIAKESSQERSLQKVH